MREQMRHVQRIQKTLTEANIRLDSVAAVTSVTLDFAWQEEGRRPEGDLRGRGDQQLERPMKQSSSGAEGLYGFVKFLRQRRGGQDEDRGRNSLPRTAEEGFKVVVG